MFILSLLSIVLQDFIRICLVLAVVKHIEFLLKQLFDKSIYRVAAYVVDSFTLTSLLLDAFWEGVCPQFFNFVLLIYNTKVYLVAKGFRRKAKRIWIKVAKQVFKSILGMIDRFFKFRLLFVHYLK